MPNSTAVSTTASGSDFSRGNALPPRGLIGRLDDLFSALTHGLGVIMAGVYFGVLLAQAITGASPRRITAFSIYGACLLLTYLFSTLYHGFPGGRTKNCFRLLDHISIFLCIAGSYTPVILVSFRSLYMVVCLTVIWAVALLGIGLKIRCFFGPGLNAGEKYSLPLYLVMGWLALFMLPRLLRVLAPGCLWFIAGGGALYSLGVIFYVLDGRLPFNHTLWHLCILGASSLQFVAFLVYLV